MTLMAFLLLNGTKWTLPTLLCLILNLKGHGILFVTFSILQYVLHFKFCFDIFSISTIQNPTIFK